MNNELRDRVIEIVRDVYDRQAQVCDSADEIIELVEAALTKQQEAEPVVEVGEGQILQWAPPYKRYPEGTKFYLHPPKPAALPTMDDAIAAGNGTLHGAIDYWQERALKAEAAQPQVPERIHEKYHELLYHVSMVFPNESRHETALRYIKSAEAQKDQCSAATEEGK